MGAVIGLIIYFGAVAVAVILGNKKGRPAIGWVLGILLAWVGVIIVACLPDKKAKALPPPPYAGYYPPPGYYAPLPAPAPPPAPQERTEDEPDWTALKP